jgi:hypothetical protein
MAVHLHSQFERGAGRHDVTKLTKLQERSPPRHMGSVVIMHAGKQAAGFVPASVIDRESQQEGADGGRVALVEIEQSATGVDRLPHPATGRKRIDKPALGTEQAGTTGYSPDGAPEASEQGLAQKPFSRLHRPTVSRHCVIGIRRLVGEDAPGLRMVFGQSQRLPREDFSFGGVLDRVEPVGGFDQSLCLEPLPILRGAPCHRQPSGAPGTRR